MSSRRIYLFILLASVVCAITAWGGVHTSHPLLRLPDDLFGLSQPTTEQYTRIRAHQNLNDTIGLVVFGAIAMVAGLPVFGKGKSLISLLVWAIVAACIGAGAGWLMGLIGFYCEFWLPINWDKLIRASTRITATLLPLALLAALVTMISLRNYKQFATLAIAAVLGSVAAAVAYSLVTGIVLPRENADAVLPPGIYGRLLLFGIAPLAIWSTLEHQLHSGGKTEPAPSTAELNVV